MAYIETPYELMNETITTAQSIATKNSVQLFRPVTTAVIECLFDYGSGGTTAKVYVQSSVDDGVTWFDIACFAHTTADLNRVCNLSALTPVTTIYTLTSDALTDDTTKDGLLGDRFRVRFVSTGTYAGSTTCKVFITPKEC